MPDLPAFTPAISTPATEPALARLYGAALGSVHGAYYLAVFDRFEALGRWRSSWNWTAATLTLNWLLFRQLWLAALVYGSFLLLVPLLMLGLGRYLLALPSSIERGLWLSFLLLSVVVPGLWGNALLYLDSQRRINQALTASATLDQACALLLRRASGRKHAIGLMMVNALLVGLALAAYVGWQGATVDTPDVAVSGVVVNEPAATASRMRPASAATSAASSVQVAAPAGVASLARGGRTTGLSAYASAPWATSAPASAASTAAVAASRPLTGRVFVNVGLFAQAANAQQVHTQLVAAGLPVLSDQINNAQGQQRTRVRVGPFANRAQAQAAVVQVKTLQLDAVLAP
jgi:cell division septation protein DedD